MSVSMADQTTCDMTVHDLYLLMSIANQNFGEHQSYGHLKIVCQHSHGTFNKIYNIQIKRAGKTGIDVKSFNARTFAKRPDRIWKWLGPKIEAWNSWAAKQKK